MSGDDSVDSHTLSVHSTNTHPQYTLLTHPTNTPYHHNHHYQPTGGCMSGDDSVDESDVLSLLRRQCPRRGCVMTVTQFDGIPMADCFKV